MPMPTVAKTYQYVINGAVNSGVLLNDERAFLLAMKNAFIGFASSPWVVRYSCNSTVAGTPGDGVDRWVTGTNIVWGAAGAAQSWMVLRQTGVSATFELLIAPDQAAINGVSFVVSRVPFTGGTTTARPTTTDGIVIMPASANEFWLASPQAMRWHFMQSTDGAITRAILNRTGTGAGMQFFLGIEQLANPVTGWVNEPWVALCKGSGNGVAIAMNSPIICSGYWLAKPAAAYISGVACTEGVSGNVLCAPGFSAGQVANEIDGSWFMLPVAWYGQSVGSRGRHGTLVDFWIGSEAVPYGDTYPNDATYQFAQFGCVIVKWNGVIPQL